MDFFEHTKSAFKNAYLSGIKKKLILLGIGILVFIIIMTILVSIILVEDEESQIGNYNSLSAYSFWWPIGSRETTLDEDGNEYAIKEPSAITISSDYKIRNPERPDHNGIDISSTDTENVYRGEGYHYIIASKDGTVSVSHLSDTAGEYIAIDHGDGFVTKYMHMYEGSRRVQEGDIVKQGQILGIMGNTGNSTGAHLHFQIELDGEPVDPLQYVSAEFPRGGANIDPFTTSISREDFIECVKQYSMAVEYQTNMAQYAGEFYDICTEKGVNAELAFAHACLETDYGTYFIAKNNYFGYAAYNSNPNAAASYETPQESIRSYCDWVINNATMGTSAYQANLERAEELSPYNSTLIGTPETNVYILYIRYAQLDATHEGNYAAINRNDITSVKYLGTYYFTYYMYGEMCNHLPGEPTSEQEKADYAVYSTNKRIEIINSMFGK